VLTKSGRPKKASTLYADTGRIERHIVPLLGDRTVKALTSSDVRGLIRDVTQGKTAGVFRTERGYARVEGGSTAAARTAALLSAVMTYCVEEGYRDDNPAHGVKLPAANLRAVHLSAEKYASLGDALNVAEDKGESWRAVAVIRLLALTGCRLNEIAGLKRVECDVAGSALRLADSKTGATVRPLGRAAKAALVQALGRSNSQYVFPATRGSGRYSGLPQAWLRIVKPVAGLEALTPHWLRHGFAGTADDLGFTDATTAAIIGHSRKRVGTTRGYIHKVDAALIAAADRVSDRIAAMMAGEEVQTGEVVDLAKAARQG
jgi:integrase